MLRDVPASQDRNVDWKRGAAIAAFFALALTMVVVGHQRRTEHVLLTSTDAHSSQARPATHSHLAPHTDAIESDMDKTEKDIKGLGDRLINDFDSMVLLHKGAKNVTGEAEKGDWLIRMGLKQAERGSELMGKKFPAHSPELDSKWIKTFRDASRQQKVQRHSCSLNVVPHAALISLSAPLSFFLGLLPEGVMQIKTAQLAYSRLQGSMQTFASAVDRLDKFVKEAKKGQRH
eukprot:758439-Hanusia_phi.AAC.3